MTAAGPAAPEVLSERVDGCGVLQLNRPAALNALTTPMVAALDAVLVRWLAEDLQLLLVESTTPRAFSAGGDMRAVAAHARAGDRDAVVAFFTAEYGLDLRLAGRRVPQVSLMDGICMGGGVGLAVHGTHRVVTERTVLAMPEVAIGFFPDVGTSHVLPRLPGAVGAYLALTGARLSGADAVWSGIATHLVESADLPALRSALLAPARPAVDDVLAEYARPVDHSELAAHREQVDACFSAPEVDEIVERLEHDGSPWATSALDRMRAASPVSLQLTHLLLQRGAGRTLAECFDAELRLAVAVTATPDFQEGVRAVLVDKDHAPRWSATPSADEVARWFDLVVGT